MIDFDDVNEMKEEEEPPPAKRGRKDEWTKTSHIKLENAEKGLQRMKKSSAFRLAQGDKDDEANAEENIAPYREAQRAPLNAFEHTGSQKKHSFPTIAHNYTFWADLIFEPKSRTRGMVLFVEGTSRWCWCHPFKNKSARHIASVVEKFVKAIDEQGVAGHTTTHRGVWICVEEEECDTHRAWCHGKTGQDSEDTQVVHVSHLAVQRRRAD